MVHQHFKTSASDFSIMVYPSQDTLQDLILVNIKIVLTNPVR